MKVSLVYTGVTPELIELVEREVKSQLPADTEIVSHKDPTIIAEVAKIGYVTKEPAARLVKMFMESVEENVDGILNICSSVGEVADACQDLARYTGVPIVRIDEETKNLLPKLKNLIKQAGFNPDYYTATNSAFDEPYDAYKPTGKNANSQIEIMQDDGSLIELSQLSPLVRALNGTFQGDERFFFPKTMLSHNEDQPQIFEPLYEQFQKYIKNGALRYLRRPKREQKK